MVDNTVSTRDKAIFLLMVSSGIQRVEIVDIRIKDLQRIEKYDLYMITVYAKTSAIPCFQYTHPYIALFSKKISRTTCDESRSRIHLLSYLAKQWDVFLVGAAMTIGFTVVVLKLIGFF
jgi:site-specific recombinase XerC